MDRIYHDERGYWRITINGEDGDLRYWEKGGHSRDNLRRRCGDREKAKKSGGKLHTPVEIVYQRGLSPIKLPHASRGGGGNKWLPKPVPDAKTVKDLFSPRMLEVYE